MKKPIKQNTQTGAVDVGFIAEIRRLITIARSTVAKNVNYVQVHTCFEIGRRIVEREQKGSSRVQYGKQLIIDLSTSLTTEFGMGFSERNLRNMRKFYLVYQERFKQIWQTLSAKFTEAQKNPTLSTLIQTNNETFYEFKLSWSQYVFLIGIKDEDARSFYEIEAANNNWTLLELTQQFNSGLYERLVLSRDKKGKVRGSLCLTKSDTIL